MLQLAATAHTLIAGSLTTPLAWGFVTDLYDRVHKDVVDESEAAARLVRENLISVVTKLLASQIGFAVNANEFARSARFKNVNFAPTRPIEPVKPVEPKTAKSCPHCDGKKKVQK